MTEKAPSLKDLTREMPSSEEFSAIMGGIDDLHARAAILTLTAFIDNSLEKAISLHFIRLGSEHFDRVFRNSGAPLGTFSAKINIAYALGIISAEHRSQCDRIRTIRNAFAHTVKPIDFDYPAVAEECMKLDPQRLLPGGRYVADKDTPRERFTVSAMAIATALLFHIRDKREPPASSPDKS